MVDMENKLHWGTNCMDCLDGLKLMKDNSNGNDIIMDIFSGSGTTQKLNIIDCTKYYKD